MDGFADLVALGVQLQEGGPEDSVPAGAKWELLVVLLYHSVQLAMAVVIQQRHVAAVHISLVKYEVNKPRWLPYADNAWAC